MKRSFISLQLLLIIHISLLSACGPVIPAVVEERKVTGVKQETDRIGGAVVRLVQPGDTLYAIAFDNGVDARDFAAWNGLSLDSQIEVGQKLRLTEPFNFVAQTPPPSRPVLSVPNTAVNTPPTTIANTIPSPPTSVRPDPIIQNTNPPPSNIGGSATVHNGTVTPVQPALPSASDRPLSQSVAQWQWPITGKLLRGFELNRGQQGIDIQGVPGQSVMASAAGQVVYAGDGLKGYGNLIIIKHDDEFLSAYANNEAIFVKEGERVKQASIIASMGTNQYGESALQFQIRKGGSPVDPLSYLPRL